VASAANPLAPESCLVAEPLAPLGCCSRIFLGQAGGRLCRPQPSLLRMLSHMQRREIMRRIALRSSPLSALESGGAFALRWDLAKAGRTVGVIFGPPPFQPNPADCPVEAHAPKEAKTADPLAQVASLPGSPARRRCATIESFPWAAPMRQQRPFRLWALGMFCDIDPRIQAS
jgi:hypothetical protein